MIRIRLHLHPAALQDNQGGATPLHLAAASTRPKSNSEPLALAVTSTLALTRALPAIAGREGDAPAALSPIRTRHALGLALIGYACRQPEAARVIELLAREHSAYVDARTSGEPYPRRS